MCRIEQFLATCETACREGGRQLMAWRSKFSHQEKSVHDLVTDADIASQQAVKSAIESSYPDHGFLGEESADFSELEKEYCWVVDPLDGTTNYVHGFPCYAVSVGLAKQGELIVGGVYDPLRDEMFLAGQGVGARLNGELFTTSGRTEISESLIAVSFPPQTSVTMPDVQAFLSVAPHCRAVRRTGSAALNLAYVACGRLDAHFAYKIFPWDVAAGVVLIREAGGAVSAADGEEFDLRRAAYMTASSEQLRLAVLEQIAVEA